MKKIIYLITAVLTAMLFVSCIYEKGRRMDSEVIYANAEDTAVCDYDVRLLFEMMTLKYIHLKIMAILFISPTV